MTIELIFGLVQAVVTAILGSFTKKGKVPKKYIPLQNILIGVLAALVAFYFGVYTDLALALFICLATSLGVGGAYDASQFNRK